MTRFLDGIRRSLQRQRLLIHAEDRKGSILLLSAAALVALLGITALAVDCGYVVLVRTQLQCSADAAAMAGAGELLQQQINARYLDADVRTVTAEYAGLNEVGRQNPSIDLNGVNTLDGDLI